MRRNESLKELEELQKEFDFLLNEYFTSVVYNDRVNSWTNEKKKRITLSKKARSKVPQALLSKWR